MILDLATLALMAVGLCALGYVGIWDAFDQPRWMDPIIRRKR